MALGDQKKEPEPRKDVPLPSQSSGQPHDQRMVNRPTSQSNDSRQQTNRLSLAFTQQPSQSSPFRIPESPRSAGADGLRGKAAKIAIPRLKREADNAPGSSRMSGRHRVTHACEPCRQRKTKCSGERPMCKHCEDFKIQCYYADGKRDRVKK